MQLANKTIVVTGAGSGIGRELTLQLLRKGANVAGVDINPNALLQTHQLAGVGEDRFKAFSFDFTDRAKVDRFPEEMLTHFGAVDGIINNAGIIQPFKVVNDISINDISINEIIRVFNVNFYGTIFLTKAFLPLFLQRPEAGIINISSMGGFISFPKQTIYGAAKAAVKIFTEGLYAELKETAVKVMVVHPGAVATNITENSGLKTPKIDLTDPKKVGMANKMTLSSTKATEIIIKAIEKNKFRITVGKDAAMLDLLYRFNPKFATNMISKIMKKVVM